ncbi:LysR family transcriptional regulator [Paracoccus jiaweipingae]|uniref:LysR family transcriptional regulator n=1 Tax=unclassified Paracoccus (in: a-proteobacteria) TaxID=2688777 RepID=UPI003793B00A
MAKPRGQIELRHPRDFVATAEHGSFRKSGAAIGVQESAVSRRIRDLEDRLISMGRTLIADGRKVPWQVTPFVEQALSRN